MKRIKLFLIVATLACFGALTSCSHAPADGEYTLHICSTNDVHGRYFDSLYVGNRTQQSLISVSEHVNELRAQAGAENVILVDVGDCLQGDNAAYYYNYVDTKSPHLYIQMAEYMKYDAVVVGNHDIEAGHPVYDRIKKEMHIPFLAGNAFHEGTNKTYFQDYTIVDNSGLKVAIIGFTNANIKNWLEEKIWKGIEFKSLLPLVQETVDRVTAKENPDVVVVGVHSGNGLGDGSMYENQGLDLYKSLRGVDFLLTSHDHQPATCSSDSICLINTGSRCKNLGHGVINVKVENGKVVSKSLSCELIPVDKNKVDTVMREKFRPQFEAVRTFSTREIGKLDMDLRTRDAYRGMSSYVNLVHYAQLTGSSAEISFAAPLTFNGFVKAGTLIYQDMFTVYPFENQLFVSELKGSEILNYLEDSYDHWINTVSSPKDDHILKISKRKDDRFGQDAWSFDYRSYNFDSAAGINYTVDITKPKGERINITTLVDGRTFSVDSTYKTAMTSYRAAASGKVGAITLEEGIMQDRIIEKNKEIRDIIYDLVIEKGTLDDALISDKSIIGSWKFVPESIAEPLLDKDMALLFIKKE